MSLTDADLDRIERQATNGHAGAHDTRALLAEVRALRAQVAGTDGPEQGAPAAWLLVGSNGYTQGVTTDPDEAARWRRPDVAHLNFTVVALIRAPGAVAAAPPGDEDLGRLVREVWVAWAHEQDDPKPHWLTGWDDLDAGQREVDVRIGRAVADAALRGAVAAAPPGDEQTPCGPCQRGQHGVCDGPNPYWPDCTCTHGIPIAPPAGHEDEAAVERAARALYDHEFGSGSWDAQEGPGRHEVDRERVRVVLAAARGEAQPLRTSDPGADA